MMYREHRRFSAVPTSLCIVMRRPHLLWLLWKDCYNMNGPQQLSISACITDEFRNECLSDDSF